MNELEQTYKDKVDFIRFDLATRDGVCEIKLHNFTAVPSMMVIDRNGKTVFTAQEFTEKETLVKNFEEALKRQ